MIDLRTKRTMGYSIAEFDNNKGNSNCEDKNDESNYGRRHSSK